MPKLLLIEDNSQTQRIYSEKFRHEGFDVTTAADGEQGLATAKTTHPDAILLDIMLPKLSGLDILKEFQSDASLRQIPVFVLSNRAWPTDVQEALSLGARQFYSKGSASLQNIATHIRTECGFKKVNVITGNLVVAQPILNALNHPQILCAVQTVACEACSVNERSVPDLIILDGRPTTAAATLQQLKSSQALRDVPIIAITDQPVAFHRADGCIPVGSITISLQQKVFDRLGLNATAVAAHAQN